MAITARTPRVLYVSSWAVMNFCIVFAYFSASSAFATSTDPGRLTQERMPANGLVVLKSANCVSNCPHTSIKVDQLQMMSTKQNTSRRLLAQDSSTFGLTSAYGKPIAFDEAPPADAKPNALRFIENDMGGGGMDGGAGGMSFELMLHSASPAYRFLGIGYDIVAGNPSGDPSLMADPGLRAPIYKFEYQQKKEQVARDIQTLEPPGAYSRPFVACRQSETVHEINSISDYQEQLNIDTSIEGEANFFASLSFSASAGYKNTAQSVAENGSRLFMIKSYCVNYEAGMDRTHKEDWLLQPAFEHAIELLPDNFQPGACSPERWGKNPDGSECKGKDSIRKWMSFLRSYGTHAIMKLYAGGKMSHLVKMTKKDVQRLKEINVDLKAAVKFSIGSLGGGGLAGGKTTHDKLTEETKNMQISVETLIMGGLVPAEFKSAKGLAEWSSSVITWPMPVKYTLVCLSDMLPPTKTNPFLKAVAYYAMTYGMKKELLFQLINSPIMDQVELGAKLSLVEEVAESGMAGMQTTCPGNEKIGFGFNFAILTSHYPAFRFSLIPTGKSEYTGPTPAEHKDMPERHYVGCGYLNGVHQITAVSEVSCPKGTTMLGGFGVSVANNFRRTKGSLEKLVKVKTCESQKSKCIFNQQNPASDWATAIYALCADSEIPGILDISSHADLSPNGFTLGRYSTCPEGAVVVAGFVMGIDQVMRSRNEMQPCVKGQNTCLPKAPISSNPAYVMSKPTNFVHIRWYLCANTTAKTPVEAVSKQG